MLGLLESCRKVPSRRPGRVRTVPVVHPDIRDVGSPENRLYARSKGMSVLTEFRDPGAATLLDPTKPPNRSFSPRGRIVFSSLPPDRRDQPRNVQDGLHTLDSLPLGSSRSVSLRSGLINLSK